jgi:histone H3/H4
MGGGWWVAVTRQEMGRTLAKVREARGDGGPAKVGRKKNEAMQAAMNNAKLSGNAAGGETVVRRKKYRPGVKMILEIRKMQKSTKPMLRFAPFTRLVRERGRLIVEARIGGDMERNGVRYKRAAMEMLREMVEIKMVRIMEARCCAACTGR